MLTIRREQISVFEDIMREKFVDRLLRHLRVDMPTMTADMCDTHLRTTIREGLVRAAGYGVITEWDLCRFAMYEVRLGTWFERAADNGWAREALASPDLGGTARMDLLDQHYFASPTPSPLP